MARIVLDTDVASLSYKGRLPMPLATRLIGHEACVTFVTIGELARWAEKRHWGTRARSELARWLGSTIILPYDERVAWKWGQLSVLSERRGRHARSMTRGSQRAAWSLTCLWQREI
jgi:predicted nucleic acid-binding protein